MSIANSNISIQNVLAKNIFEHIEQISYTLMLDSYAFFAYNEERFSVTV
jgi:hypothetical protein